MRSTVLPGAVLPGVLMFANHHSITTAFPNVIFNEIGTHHSAWRLGYSEEHDDYKRWQKFPRKQNYSK